MDRWSWRYWLAFALAICGLLLLAIYCLHPAFNDLSFRVNPSLASNFGSFVGGFIGSLFSLAGVLLLFETLIRQQRIFQRQQFETRFFEMVRFHRENVSEMVHKIPQEENVEVTGRRVFLQMRRQYGEILSLLKKDYSNLLTTDEVLDISYLILFFGVGSDSLDMLRYKLSKYKDKKEVTEKIIEELRKKKSKGLKTVYFGGHQSRLGHYFRHLFQSVKYIDSQSFLSEAEKYEYVKTLRAQFSTEELVIFFFNSLSQLGEQWEQAVARSEHKLVTKYKFIKNIPQGFTFGIEPKNYYKFEYEYEENP